MKAFGDTAVQAVELYRTEGHLSPRAAWDEAGSELLGTASLREKGCPRATFLSLCQAGLVTDVPAGEYTRAQENRDHALEAVRRLSIDPGLAEQSPGDLWKLIAGGGPRYNQQMHVVLALWKAGLIQTDVLARADARPSAPPQDR
jgi:hypothetical protein